MVTAPASEALRSLKGLLHSEVPDGSRPARRESWLRLRDLIVIAGQPDRSARERIELYAVACGRTVEFLLYRVETKLVPHPK